MSVPDVQMSEPDTYLRPPPVRPSPVAVGGRREEILDAALEIASAHGFEGVRMRAVAARAGTAASALYRHYASKTHLLVTVLAREIERLDAEFHWSADELTSPQRWARLTARLHQRWLDEPALTDAMVRAFVVADAGAADAVQYAVGVIEDMFAHALGGPAPAARERHLAGLIADIWLANLTAVISGRVNPADARERIDRTVGQLLAALPRTDVR